MRCTSGARALQAWAACCLLLPALSRARLVDVEDSADLVRAVRSAAAGDTIRLADGQYSLEAPLILDGVDDITVAGRSGNPEKAVLYGRGFASMGNGDDILRIGACSSITVSGLGFRDCHAYGIKVEAEKLPRDIRIVDCDFRDIGTRHIKGSTSPQGKARGGSVRGCRFENTRLPGADWNSGGNYIAAIDMMALEDWTFSDNEFRNVRGRTGQGRAAIFIWVGSRNVVVERNLIMGCDRGIALGNPSPSTNNAGLHVSGAICRNNFILPGPDAGIELAWVEDVLVAHNSIWREDPSGRGIRSIEKIARTVIVNNLVRGRILLSGGESAGDNLEGELIGAFVDPSAGDLHLKPGAPGIDGGRALEQVAEDWDGEIRPAGKAPDIGADEFSAASPMLGRGFLEMRRRTRLSPGTRRDALGRIPAILGARQSGPAFSRPRMIRFMDESAVEIHPE